MTQITAHASANTATTGFNASATNPTNAYSSNDQYATFVSDANPRNDEYAHNWRGFDFSGIPDGSTINSVHLHIEHKLSANWSQGEFRTSVWPDVTAAAALAPGVVGAIGPDLQYNHSTASGYLSDTDWDVTLTGTLPTLAELKGTNFGIRAQIAQGNNGGTFTTSIDDIYIVVDYTAGSTTQNGNFTADATVLATMPGSTTADAAKLKTQAAATTADAIKLETQTGTPFTADAIRLKTLEGSFSAAADIFATLEASTSVEAAILATVEPTPPPTIDAQIVIIGSGDFAADATALSTEEDATTASAVILATGSDSTLADAVVLSSPESSTTFDAELWPDVWGVAFDAVIASDTSGSPVWTTPADTVGISATPSLAFNTPDLGKDLHFHMQLDKVATFDGVDLQEHKSHFDQTGWEYWDGDSWEPVPATGLPSAFAGNEARYTVQTPLSAGTWYRRVRAG